MLARPSSLLHRELCSKPRSWPLGEGQIATMEENMETIQFGVSGEVRGFWKRGWRINWSRKWKQGFHGGYPGVTKGNMGIVEHQLEIKWELGVLRGIIGCTFRVS